MIKNQHVIKRLFYIMVMLESKTARLESSHLRRILCLYSKHLKSQHKLHTENNGINIENLGSRRTRPKSKEAYIATTNLDFLYPPSTLRIALRAKLSILNELVKRPTKLLLKKNEARRYSSLPFTKNSSESSNTWENFQQVYPNFASLLTKEGISEIMNPRELQKQIYRLNSKKVKKLSLALLRYLLHSSQNSDANVILKLFQQLDSHEKEADICEFVIQAYLKQNDLSNAREVYQFSWENFGIPSGCTQIFSYTVQNHMWSEAYKLWLSEKSLYLDFNFYRFLDKSAHEISIARSLIAWVNNGEPTTDLQSPELMKFCTVIIRNSLKLVDLCSDKQYLFVLESTKNWKLPDKEIYTNAILLLAKKQKNDLLLKSYSVLRLANSFYLSQAALLRVLDASCNRHDVHLMKQVLDDFFTLHSKPSRAAYRMCLKEFSRQGDLKTVHALFSQYISRYKTNSIESFQKMRYEVSMHSKLDKSGKSYHFEKIDESAPLTANDFAPLLHVYARRGEIREVEKTFDQIRDVYGIEQDRLCWNILLSGYIKTKQVEKAYDCFDEILSNPNVKPDHYTLGTMMALYASRADLVRAKELYNQAKEFKIPPSAAMLNGLVVCLLRNDRYKDAEAVCFETISMDLIGSKIHIWNSLVAGYAMNRDITNVNRIFNIMFEKNIEYDQYTFSALMQALVMTRQPNLAAKVLFQVMPKSGIIPNTFHFAVLLGGYLAVKDWVMFYRIYQEILQSKIRSNASTKFLTLRAATSEDAELFQNGTTGEKFKRSFQIFSETMASIDPQDISETARKGFGQEPLDVMYPAIFYSFTAYILSQYGEYKISLKLLHEYQSWLPEDRRKAGEIMKILTAMMLTRHLAHDREGVKECWDKAVALAREESKLLPPIPGSKNPEDMIEYDLRYFHQLKLNEPFGIYMKNLMAQKKVGELNKTVEILIGSGFELDNHNWNTYVKNLARNSTSYKLAFQVCERKLMPGWQGWRIQRRKIAGRRTNVPLFVRRNKRNPRLFRPFFDTMLWLARRMIDLRARAAESYEIQKLINLLKHEYPNTIKALDEIPRSNSMNESILKSDESQFEL